MEQRPARALFRVRRMQGRRVGDCQEEVEDSGDRERFPPRVPYRCLHDRVLRLAQQRWRSLPQRRWP